MPCLICGGYVKRIRGQFFNDFKKLKCTECKERFILSGNVMVKYDFRAEKRMKRLKLMEAQL